MAEWTKERHEYAMTVAEQGPPDKLDYYCLKCQAHLDGSRVTYQECCDVCGCPVILGDPLSELKDALTNIDQLTAERDTAIAQRDEIAATDFPLWERILVVVGGDKSFGRTRCVEAVEKLADIRKSEEQAVELLREAVAYVDDGNDFILRDKINTFLSDRERGR